MDLLLGYPVCMATNVRIGLQLFQVMELPSQGHLVIVSVNAVVAEAADEHPLIQLIL